MTSPAPLPLVYVARHGETAWSLTKQHTGLTDLPLTERGVRNARRLGAKLRGIPFDRVLCSPLQRARQTCEQAGFDQVATIDADLVEWNYGAYEGITTPEIHATRPGWELFRDGCPQGESPAEVAARADRVLARIAPLGPRTLLFSSGHFLHMLAARWIGLAPSAGRHFYLDTAALSILGYHHDRQDPVIRLWNECSHADGE